MNYILLEDILTSLLVILITTLLYSVIIGHIVALFKPSNVTHRRRYERVWPTTAGVVATIEILIHVASLFTQRHEMTGIVVMIIAPFLVYLMIKCFRQKDVGESMGESMRASKSSNERKQKRSLFDKVFDLLDEDKLNNSNDSNDFRKSESGSSEPKIEIDYDKFFRKIKQLATEFRDSFAGQYALEIGSSEQATAYSRVMYQYFISYYAILLDVGIKKHYSNTSQYKTEHRKLVKEFKECRGISTEVAENYLAKENAHKMIVEVFDDLRNRSKEIPSSIYLKLADVELDSVLDTLKQD